VYRPGGLARARLSNKAYAAMTLPFDTVNNTDGSLRSDKAAENRNWLQDAMEALNGKRSELRGFYRDKNGVFRVLTAK
jgi:hypothetical protein